MTTLLAISVGGDYVDLPMPAMDGYTTKLEDLSKSSRNQAGTLYKRRIAEKHTINVTWNAKTPDDKNLITSLTSKNAFNVRYLDVDDDKIKYGLFYRGTDYQVTPIIRYDKDNNKFVRYNVTMSMVEF